MSERTELARLQVPIYALGDVMIPQEKLTLGTVLLSYAFNSVPGKEDKH